MRVPLIYKDAPVFGFDLGSRSAKVVQLTASGSRRKVVGYGATDFANDAIVEGIVSDPKLIAKAVRQLLDHPTAGHITAGRVVVALPASKVFIRTLQLPPMEKSDLQEAIRLEAEQYVPVPINDLYIDYEVVKSTPTAEKVGDNEAEQHIDVLMVAAPRAIVDSYVQLFDVLNLEIDAFETTLAAITRAMTVANAKSPANLLLDFGSRSVDLAVYSQVLKLTGTIAVGGDDLTLELSKKLAISLEQANEIKYKFGLGTSGLQAKILEALDPKLQTAVAEIKKVAKFYKERSENKEEISSVTLTGGGASLPGLADYLYKATGLPMVIADPWLKLELGRLAKADKLEAPTYTTAIGLALRGINHD